MNTFGRSPYDRRRRSKRGLPHQLRLPFTIVRGQRRPRRPHRTRPARAYPAMPFLRREIVPPTWHFGSKPLAGLVILYELAASRDVPTVYVGQTRQALSSRVAGHISLARHRRRKNRRLEAWIWRLAESRGTLVVRMVGLFAAGQAADDAERALIAECRMQSGPALLNQGPGGEHAPVGRLMSEEERERRRVVRRSLQREAGYRRNQALACSRRRHAPDALNALLAHFAVADPVVTMADICSRHGVTEGALRGTLSGKVNGLVVCPALLGAARTTQTRREALRTEQAANASAAVLAALRTYLAAAPGTTLTAVALTQGLAPRRLQETVRRVGLGIPEALARAVRARMDEDRRLRGRELGRRAARVDRRLLRWLLTAYARPGSGLTQSSIAARLGISQGAVSHLLAGRKGLPLPRRLLRACRARARALRYGAGRSGVVG